MRNYDALLKELDYNPKTGLVCWRTPRRGRKLGWWAGSLSGRKNYDIRFDGKNYKVHRVAFYAMHGWLPDEVDHIDRNPANNKGHNLRAATRAQNCRNLTTRSDNSSGYAGVSHDKSRDMWAAYINIDGKRRHLGRFTELSDAITARKKAELKLFGEFAPSTT